MSAEIAPHLKGPAQKMRKLIEEILTGERSLDAKNIYIIVQARIAAKMSLSKTDEEKRVISQEAERFEKVGVELKFSKEETWGINAAVLLMRGEGKLEEFVEKADAVIKKTSKKQ
jgi:hypothetical protein